MRQRIERNVVLVYENCERVHDEVPLRQFPVLAEDFVDLALVNNRVHAFFIRLFRSAARERRQNPLQVVYFIIVLALRVRVRMMEERVPLLSVIIIAKLARLRIASLPDGARDLVVGERLAFIFRLADIVNIATVLAAADEVLVVSSGGLRCHKWLDQVQLVALLAIRVEHELLLVGSR